MGRFVRWYGSGPLHLLVLIASFALTGYAMVRLFALRPLGVVIWFVGAAVVHDLILLPLYSLADRSAQAVLRHRATRMPHPPWINHLRVPAFLSGVLLLVWFPLVFALSRPYPGATGLSIDVYLGRWLAITAVLFLASAVAFAVRLRRLRRAHRAGGERPAPDHGAGP
ncbi:hypothetical protein [Streptomyces thermodiastaticus]|uniref:hypothetical protein n=1 Tax=Streptomyces thermodiastaticus TaxID=44061 RepID=UPI00167593D3|nr:hypothetical protein [Streptomyces thermodiastaticus]MCE7552173.1 hypothetical protein [Streptomyces thermodiastaticus]GHF82760.1 hypothetical protein GCM10018787_34490 [Streptomyces thermodiastaticus]